MYFHPVDDHPAFLEDHSDSDMPSKYWHLVHMHRYFKRRTTVLGWLTVTQRPYLKLTKEQLSSSCLACIGDVVELAWLLPPEDTSKASNIGLTYYAGTEELEGVDSKDKVFGKEGYAVYGVTVNPEDKSDIYLVKLSDNAMEPPYRFADEFDLPAGILPNCTNQTYTDVGKFLMNYLLLTDPFGSLFPYRNEMFNLGSIEKDIASNILEGKITREQFNVYMNNGYWFGEDASVTTATVTPKAITTDPRIKIRKQELLEQYKDQLDDANITSKIENELVAMDKEWIKGDPSANFYDTDGNKAYKEQRKKMHIFMGLMAGFDKVEGKYEFVSDSLRGGWSLDNLDIAANDVRRGSYGRGIETALGGTQSKFILRIFQGLRIIEDDCGSKKGIKLKLTEDNISFYYGRWVVGETESISKENKSRFIGKEVVLRSPMYCTSEGGFCYKCCGDLFKKLGMPMAGMNALIITSGFTTTAMKSQHMSSVASVTIKDIQHYLR